MDIILDTDIIVDICTQRMADHTGSLLAYNFAKANQLRIWGYTGCLHSLYSSVTREVLRGIDSNNDKELSLKEAEEQAKGLLQSFCRTINWLASLSEDSEIFMDGDPVANQYTKALHRLGNDAILLTRNETLLNEIEKTISVDDFIAAYQDKTPSPIPFIDLAAQQDGLRRGLEKNVHVVLHHGQYIIGPEVRELEKSLSQFVSVKHAVTCSSGTDALLMPLMAMDIGHGDAVFVTPFTFIATAEVVSLLGATPIFVDIDPRTFNMDPEKLRAEIDHVKEKKKLRPRAIIPVDLFGLPADYDSIMSIAKEEGLFVIEDAAQGFGGIYKGRRAGSLAHVAATSFFPAKPLGGYGDGGAIFTDDGELAEKLISIRVHGKGKNKYENIRIGLNARLDTLQAALLLPKLEVFPEELEKRQQVAGQYSGALRDLSPSLECPFIPAGLQSAWAQYSLVADRRDFIQEELKKEGIPSVVYYPTPLHLQPAFSNLAYKKGDFPISEATSRRIFSLPMSPYLAERHIEKITRVLRDRVC